MESEDKLRQKAKTKDDGRYAILGMRYKCASYFDIDIHSEQVWNIVEKYIESINYCIFSEWIRSKEVYNYIETNRW